MTPKEAIAFAKKNNAVAADLKFLDFIGIWQHFTIPMSEFDEALFEAEQGDRARHHQRGGQQLQADRGRSIRRGNRGGGRHGRILSGLARRTMTAVQDARRAAPLTRAAHPRGGRPARSHRAGPAPGSARRGAAARSRLRRGARSPAARTGRRRCAGRRPGPETPAASAPQRQWALACAWCACSPTWWPCAPSIVSLSDTVDAATRSDRIMSFSLRW